MRQLNLRALLSWVILIISISLALSTLLYSSLPFNLILLLTFLSLSLLTIGLYGLLISDRRYFALSVGGQLAWSCCSLALQEASLLSVWTMFFLQLALLFLGLRGMWVSIYSSNKTSGRIWKTTSRSLLVTFEWLGATAVLSAAILLVVPLFRTSMGLLLLAALFLTALISFSFLAMRSISFHAESKMSETPSNDLN